jgi:hypothetical protein
MDQQNQAVVSYIYHLIKIAMEIDHLRGNNNKYDKMAPSAFSIC